MMLGRFERAMEDTIASQMSAAESNLEVSWWEQLAIQREIFSDWRLGLFDYYCASNQP